MEFIQHTRLVKNLRGHCNLIREVRDKQNRLIKYEHLDETPILPSSPYYSEYLRAKDMDNIITDIIKRVNFTTI